MVFAGKLAFHCEGLSILVGPEIETIEGIWGLRPRFMEDLPEGNYVQIDEGVGLGGGYTGQRGIQLNGDGPRIVRRIPGRGIVGVDRSHELAMLVGRRCACDGPAV